MPHPDQDSLGLRIQQGRPLSLDEQSALVALLGFGCREKTKLRLASVLRFVTTVPNCGIYDRVLLKDEGKVSYCAGQSYPDEIRTVRELLLGKA